MQVMEKLKNFSKKFENHGGFCPIIFGIIYKVNLTQVEDSIGLKSDPCSSIYLWNHPMRLMASLGNIAHLMASLGDIAGA